MPGVSRIPPDSPAGARLHRVDGGARSPDGGAGVHAGEEGDARYFHGHRLQLPGRAGEMPPGPRG